MIVGRLFTYLGQRYEPGSDFDIKSIAESRRSSFIRLYGLSERSAPTKKRKKAFVPQASPVLKDITEEPPTGGVQGEDLNG